MFKLARIANTTIKEVFSLDTSASINRFKNRFASLFENSVEKSEANRMVVAVEPHFLYVVVSGLHGDEANYNGDFFKWSELLKKKSDNLYTFQTWRDQPVLENHDMKSKRGMIVDAWAIKNEKSIDMLHRVDERINPNLVKGIRNGSIKGTSMGVMVGHSYCSICNNLAYDEDGWCSHLCPSELNIKGKRYTGQDGNLYPDKIGTIVTEDNRDLTGVEDSYITLGEPADPKALLKSVLA
jgi:hypothetical protein